MKHLKADKAITEKEAALLQKKLDKKEQGVELLGKDKPFYLGYCPIESNNSMLICIVKKSVVDNVTEKLPENSAFYNNTDGKFYTFCFLPDCFTVFQNLILQTKKQNVKKEIVSFNYRQ